MNKLSRHCYDEDSLFADHCNQVLMGLHSHKGFLFAQQQRKSLAGLFAEDQISRGVEELGSGENSRKLDDE